MKNKLTDLENLVVVNVLIHGLNKLLPIIAMTMILDGTPDWPTVESKLINSVRANVMQQTNSMTVARIIRMISFSSWLARHLFLDGLFRNIKK
jgi:hypothetical protein